MQHHVCPVWVGYVLANPLRKLYHPPHRILLPWVSPGMTVLDVGSAMGFFSVPLAHLVGETGQVICVDVQQKMLQRLQKRAARAGVGEQILTQQVNHDTLSLDPDVVDFALAFAVVHEVPNAQSFLQQVFWALKPNGSLLLAEPTGHV